MMVSSETWAVFSLDADDSGLLELAQSLQATNIQFMYQGAMSADYLFVMHLFVSPLHTRLTTPRSTRTTSPASVLFSMT